MKIKCLTVDDEPLALRILAGYIKQIPGLELAGQCKNALEAMTILEKQVIDLMILDIKMPKIVGTDFLRNLLHPPKVIFVTAYREYALEGYELDIVDYLVKPVSFDRFLKAVSKVKRLMGSEPAFAVKEQPVSQHAFVYMKVDRSMQKVFLDEIICIESWKDYVRVYLEHGKQLLVKQTISSTEQMLSSHQFLRIHRSFIVHVSKISSYSYMSVTVGGKEYPVGRLYKQKVLDFLQTDNQDQLT